MPTAGGFDHISGFNHPSDADFLVLEALRNRLREADSDSSDSDESGNPWLRRCRPNSKLTCPVCKADHPYAAPSNDRVPQENRYSHDARVIYASFGCPICLEDPAGPPMVVLPCGHAICQDDFRLLGGRTTNAEADAQVRQAADEETQQHRATIGRNEPAVHFGVPHFLRVDEDMDQIAIAMMQAFASSWTEAMETTGNRNRSNGTTNNTTTTTNNNNTNNNTNTAAEDDSDDSTDSEMPALIRPPVFSFDSSDDSSDGMPPPLRVRNEDSSSDEEDLPPLIPRHRFHPGLAMAWNPRFYSRSAMIPAIERLRFNRASADATPQALRRRDMAALEALSNSGVFVADVSDDSDSNFDGDDDDDDSDYQEEVLWRLGEYHPGNGQLADPPSYAGFPRLGQWLLVPEIADNNKVNLVYYCEYEQENNLFVTKQFARGTKMIPNGKHGVYVHTPPRNDSGRRFPSNNELWDVYYVKNSKPDRSRNRRRRGRQESAQVLNTIVSDPLFRYKVPRNAHLVADGKGGIWALMKTSSLPEALREEEAEATTDESDDDQGLGEMRLVHYSRLHRAGLLVGETFPPFSKIFMEKSGGVILLQPNEDPSSSFSNLWHFSVGSNHSKTLLYRGLKRDTKVYGDSTGSSVFLLSSGGRLQSVLTRVAVEYPQSDTENDDNGEGVDATGPPRVVTSFSYDLDMPVDGLQDIVDIAEGDRKQVLVHARRPSPTGSNFRWRLCRISPRTETAGERDVYMVDLDVYVPRNSRIVSDRECGVWLWKKPSNYVNPGDRCFVHVNASSEGQEEWISHCVFPPRTHLAALG